MCRTRIGEVAVYTRTTDELAVIAEARGTWFELREEGRRPRLRDGGYVRPEAQQPAIVERAKDDLVQLTWTSQWMGANRAGLTTTTLLLDFHGAKPRVRVALDCSDGVGMGGACTGPDSAHEPAHQLTCDEELHCTMSESVFLDWTSRSATRRFDLLTNATLSSKRFDAKTYANGAAFAASSDAARQRAVVEGVGLVQPLFEVAPGVVLFGAPAHGPEVAARFFVLEHQRWREIPLAFLTDANYPGADAKLDSAGSIAANFTPEAPRLFFNAYDLELRGKRKLIEVLVEEDEARSIYWIMFDPTGRTGALRVATNQPEWRHCANRVHPISASSLCIPDTGLPALVDAVASWREWDLVDRQLAPSCALTGTIDWSAKRGWIVRLGAAPCTDPILRPYGVTINRNGALGVEAVTISH